MEGEKGYLDDQNEISRDGLPLQRAEGENDERINDPLIFKFMIDDTDFFRPDKYDVIHTLITDQGV